MSIKMIQVRCPSCNAELTVEEDRDYLFCQYCGTRVVIDNDNRYVYHKIDEARISESETKRLVKLKELELKEKKYQTQKMFVFIWLGVIAFLFVIGGLGYLIGNETMEGAVLWAILVGLYGFIFFIYKHDKDKE